MIYNTTQLLIRDSKVFYLLRFYTFAFFDLIIETIYLLFKLCALLTLGRYLSIAEKAERCCHKKR